MNKDKIVSIAADVRKWAEEYASSNGFKSNLQGVCAIASAELHKRLKVEGIESVIHIAENDRRRCHVFLTVDGMILDVTATQFSKVTFYKIKEEIIFADRKDFINYWFWKPINSFNSTKDLVMQQLTDNWYPNQIAHT